MVKGSYNQKTFRKAIIQTFGEFVEKTEVFKSTILFAKNETILPAPEFAHAIYVNDLPKV